MWHERENTPRILNHLLYEENLLTHIPWRTGVLVCVNADKEQAVVFVCICVCVCVCVCVCEVLHPCISI